MRYEYIDRKSCKARTRTLLSGAQVSPKAMTALYLGILLALNLVDNLSTGGAAVLDRNLLAVFLYVVLMLLNSLLSVGFVLYCMAVRRGERAEFLTLFDGFAFAGKVIGLELLMWLLVSLWSMLFVIPGIIALYRYRFALYNLCEDPDLGIWEALTMSKRQTTGYKAQLLTLDMTYLGWGLLSALPILIFTSALSYQNIMLAMGGGAAVPLTAYLVPVALLSDLWSLVVSLFYLPHYECVTLDYFDVAKRTSGVGSGVSSDAFGGPDGLGGL